jgi:hypothetical protein
MHQERIQHDAAVKTALQIALRRARASLILDRWTGNVTRPTQRGPAARQVQPRARN